MASKALVQPTRVHVAGPVEIEGRDGRRYNVQRCLRCDGVLWSVGTALSTSSSAFPVGELVAWVEREGTLVLVNLNRPRMIDGEIRCEAP